MDTWGARQRMLENAADSILDLAVAMHNEGLHHPPTPPPLAVVRRLESAMMSLRAALGRRGWQRQGSAEFCWVTRWYITPA